MDKDNKTWIEKGTPKVSGSRQITIPIGVTGINEGDELVLLAELKNENGRAIETGRYMLEKKSG